AGGATAECEADAGACHDVAVPGCLEVNAVRQHASSDPERSSRATVPWPVALIRYIEHQTGLVRASLPLHRHHPVLLDRQHQAALLEGERLLAEQLPPPAGHRR